LGVTLITAVPVPAGAALLEGSMKDLLTKVLPLGKFWTDAWSLVEGCTPVSPGCANCWLAGMYKRNLPNLQADVAGEYTSPSGEKHYRFHGNVICHEERLGLPLRAKKPRVYAIWSDLFHAAVPDDFLNRAFDTMNNAKHHQFIIVTKRPDQAVEYLRSWPQWSPMANVTILVTMEDQQRFDERLPSGIDLAQMGWQVGILAEPLLSKIDMGSFVEGTWLKWFKWLITGGESGHGARPVHPDWVRSLRDQAQAASVPFLFKQWGEWSPYTQASPDVDDDSEQTKFLTMEWRDGDHWEDIGYPGWSDFADYVDADQCTARVGKKKAGRLIDSREWLEVP
jgi:protein gp37